MSLIDFYLFFVDDVIDCPKMVIIDFPRMVIIDCPIMLFIYCCWWWLLIVHQRCLFSVVDNINKSGDMFNIIPPPLENKIVVFKGGYFLKLSKKFRAFGANNGEFKIIPPLKTRWSFSRGAIFLKGGYYLKHIPWLNIDIKKDKQTGNNLAHICIDPAFELYRASFDSLIEMMTY